MVKLLIAAAVATSALAAAAPAAAQYYQPGYGQPYGYGQQGYGYNQGGQNYLYRVDRLTQRIDMLGQRGVLSRGEYRGLRNEAANLRYRIARSGYNGLDWRERRDIDVRLDNLERRIFAEARDGRRDGRWGNGYQNQYGNGYYQPNPYDRDGDGRRDRDDD